MSPRESLFKYLQLRRSQYLMSLREKDLDIIDTLRREHFFDQVYLLTSRRAGEGELDIFCGYYKDDGHNKAIFLSLLPGEPIMLLDKKTVEQRIENMKRQGLPYEQSQQALDEWPR